MNGAILGINSKELNQKSMRSSTSRGIERSIGTPVKNYSSGIYVRLGFAIAINVSPDILLVDEVLAVGDAEFQSKCGAKFRELKETGCTIVVVSHAMGMMEDLCENAAWLEQGELRKVGKTPEVVDAYMTQVLEHTGETAPEKPAAETLAVRGAVRNGIRGRRKLPPNLTRRASSGAF
ncbi:hypothetical protein BH23ACT12_BH23ACT12_00190 [soil metagenome]